MSRPARGAVPGLAEVVARRATLGPWLSERGLSGEVDAWLPRLVDPAAALAHLEALAAGGADIPRAIFVPTLRVLGASPSLARTIVGGGAPVLDAFAADLGRPWTTAAEHASAIERTAGGDLGAADLPAFLRRHKKREILRIGARDLLGAAGVEETVREVSALAEGSIEVAVRHARARVEAVAGLFAAGDPFRFVVLGMGKLGGEELNFSSDVDLLYLFDGGGKGTSGGPRGAQGAFAFAARIAEIATRAVGEVLEDGIVFRVDLRLRPDGQSGPIANALSAALTYYESWGQTWERAAMLKARPVGGDRELGRSFLAEMEPFIYRRFLDYETIEEIQTMKRRVDSLHRPERLERDVKLGPGGIREIEFVAQSLQLVHGGRDRRLRPRGTLAALEAAKATGMLGREEAERLADAYRFLRDVEHKIQIAEERQTQLVPADPTEERRLARRLGFHEQPGGEGGGETALFRSELERQRKIARLSFEHAFLPPSRSGEEAADHETRAVLEGAGDWRSIEGALRRMGFREPEAAAAGLFALREGNPSSPATPRRKKALFALGPMLLEEIRNSSDPDRALRHLAAFIAAIGARTSFLALLRENRATLRLLIGLFAASEYLASFVVRHPEVLDSLVRADLASPRRTREEIGVELASRLAADEGYESELDTLRRFRSEEFLRIGVNDLHGLLVPAEVHRQLSDLAEVSVEAATEIATRAVAERFGPPPGRFAVVAMGSLGGRELAYSSDLDLIFIYDASSAERDGSTPPSFDGTSVQESSRESVDSSPSRPEGPGVHEWYTKLGQRLVSVLQVATPEGVVYKIDTRLRPSGSAGPLVSSLDAFRRYHEQSSVLWERQALIRARGIAGDPGLLEQVELVIDVFIWTRGLTDEDVAEIARLRRRMEKELSQETATRWNLKLGPGGLVDVEFLVQMLELRHGPDHPMVRIRETATAIEALCGAGLLPAEEGAVLHDGHRLLRLVESRLRLERDQPGATISANGEGLAGVARRLGYEGDGDGAAKALIADLARARASVREIWNRHFPQSEPVSK